MIVFILFDELEVYLIFTMLSASFVLYIKEYFTTFSAFLFLCFKR